MVVNTVPPSILHRGERILKTALRKLPSRNKKTALEKSLCVPKALQPRMIHHPQDYSEDKKRLCKLVNSTQVYVHHQVLRPTTRRTGSWLAHSAFGMTTHYDKADSAVHTCWYSWLVLRSGS